MSTWRDRMTTAPLWALFVYFGVVFGGLLYLMQGAGSKRWLAGAIGAGFFFAVVMTTFVAVTRRRDRAAAGPAGIPDRIAVARALRTGEAPETRSLDQPLLALVERRRQQLRWASKVNPR